MLEFKVPELSDKKWVKPIMENSGEMACEYCFGNLFMWSKVYGNTIAEFNGLFLARDGNERPMYIYPCGEGDKKSAVEELIKYAHTDNEPLEMYCLTPQKVRELNDMFPDKFTFVTMRDYFDYIYLTSDLINLAGRKYHAKRNHLSFFKNNFSWQYEKITADNIDECYRMNEKWEELNRENKKDDLDNELIAINRAFNNYGELDFKGGLIRKDGEVVAYTLGEEINSKTFCTHIEKAFSDLRGSYQIINQQFAQNELSGYEYINREDDTGDEGLRKAKESYYPAILLPKYRAIYKG